MQKSMNLPVPTPIEGDIIGLTVHITNYRDVYGLSRAIRDSFLVYTMLPFSGHLTIVPRIKSEDRSVAVEILRDLAKDYEPLTLAVTGIGWEEENPFRELFIGLEPNAHWTQLEEKIRNELGAPYDNYVPRKPHISLAYRFKDKKTLSLKTKKKLKECLDPVLPTSIKLYPLGLFSPSTDLIKNLSDSLLFYPEGSQKFHNLLEGLCISYPLMNDEYFKYLRIINAELRINESPWVQYFRNNR